jgi:NAD(P)-dependent dehydrogenase (short-subunit alcohol dehydrogenase family)
MKIKGSIALVTGANRGLGQALVRALSTAGCAKVYAGIRSIEGIVGDGTVEPVNLDITKHGQVDAAAQRCGDVSILINNAGIAAFTPALGAPTMENARREMETNYFGTLAMCRAFAPILRRNGGGALVNILSVVSWFNAPVQGTYSASKAAEWSLTKAVRFELRAQGTLVVGVHAGYIDTAMTAGLTAPKSSPDDIAARIVAGIESGAEEILADERSQAVHAAVFKNEAALDTSMQTAWDDYARQQSTEH